MKHKGALLFEIPMMDGRWMTLATQTSDMPPATISDNRPKGRDIYVTQAFADHATIKRLPGGVDIEQGAGRFIDATELARAVLIKRLEHDESHEMTMRPDGAPLQKTFRYRFVKLP